MPLDAPDAAADAVPAPPSARRLSLRELFSAALTARMLGLLAIILLAAVVCVRLGAWQIDRAFERADAASASEAAALSDAPPGQLGARLEPGAHVMGVLVGMPLEVTGTFDPDGQVLIPDRVVDGKTGYLVVTPLEDAATGAWLAVIRGWTPDADAVPAAPSGEVTLVGAVTAGEAYEAASLPEGQVSSISPAYFAGVWGIPLYNAYFVPTATVADDAAGAEALTVVPPPVLDGGGVDIRNLAYAVEWYVFGGFALLVWYRLVREEALARREDAAAAAPPDPAAA